MNSQKNSKTLETRTNHREMIADECVLRDLLINFHYLKLDGGFCVITESVKVNQVFFNVVYRSRRWIAHIVPALPNIHIR